MAASHNRYPAIEGEFEAEFEDEDFVGLTSSPAREYEDEAEAEGEFEGAHEYEAEAEYEFEFEAEAAAELEAEGELEDEFEAEFEEEAEGFVNPVRRIYRDAELMAHLSAKAAAVEGEAEAEAFIGALIPLAAKLIPRAASLITRNAPTLIKGVNQLSRRLRRDPRTRGLVRAMPVILQRTAQALADQSPDVGTNLTPSQIVSTLGDVATSVLAPQRRRRALNAVQVFDQRYRRRAAWHRGRMRDRRGMHYRLNGASPNGYPRRRTVHSPGLRRVRRRY